MENITLTVNGQTASVPKGSTLLQAARAAGADIPTLCHLHGHSPKGTCRMCAVQVDGGATRLACAVKAADGMDVQTETPAVQQARKDALLAILAAHPLDCYSCVRIGNSRIADMDPAVCATCFYCDCVKDGDCELQQLMEKYEVDEPAENWAERKEPVDESLAAYVYNPNKCIDCRRCVSSCGEVQGLGVWQRPGKGDAPRAKTEGGVPLAETDCVQCGLCVRNCPVAALHETLDYDGVLDAAQDKTRPTTARVDAGFVAQMMKLAGLNTAQYGPGHLAAGMARLGAAGFELWAPAQGETLRLARSELAAAPAGRAVISAVCPAGAQLVQKKYPALAACLSRVQNPQQQFFAAQPGHALALSSCIACKAAAQPAPAPNGDALVISPRELYRIFTRSGVNMARLQPAEIPAAQQQPPAAQPAPGVYKGQAEIAGRSIRVASAIGLRAACEVLDELAGNAGAYGYVQIQACPDGCTSLSEWLFPFGATP